VLTVESSSKQQMLQLLAANFAALTDTERDTSSDYCT